MKKRMLVAMVSVLFALSTASAVLAQQQAPAGPPAVVKEMVAKASGSIQKVAAADVKAAIDKKEKAVILDLRDPNEFAAGHLPEAINISRGTLEFVVFNKIADQIQNGSGTLSKLIQNPQLFDNANEALKKADVMMARIEQGEGTLGRLSRDPALYDRTNAALEKFANFVDQIEKGQGTLGKLYKDPSLYDNLNQTTAEITKLIYDLRQDPKKYLTIRFRLF